MHQGHKVAFQDIDTLLGQFTTLQVEFPCLTPTQPTTIDLADSSRLTLIPRLNDSTLFELYEQLIA